MLWKGSLMTQLFPEWLEAKPMIEAVKVELTPPRLGDNIADLDRLTRARAAQGFAPVLVDPGQLGRLAAAIRRLGYRATAILGFVRLGWELLDVVPIDAGPPLLGCALDLGTTSLAFYLVDLQTARVIAQTSVKNPQIPYGEDILTRIIYARSPENLEHLRHLLLDTIRAALSRLVQDLGADGSAIHVLTVAGNTTMSHFFLGLDPATICKEPYIPVANTFPILPATLLDLGIHPRAPVYVFPNVGSYFGGDLIAGILATGMRRRDELSLLVDVGTNAEVVLGNRDWLIACAGAAGPALEGGVVERGMMAAPGAIDRVRIDPETDQLSYTVLGGGKPVGICGSGLIDLLAQMFLAGLLTIQGKINTDLACPRIRHTEDGPAFVVAFGEETADGEDLLVTQIDIGILLKSKAAMYTILNVICNKVGVSLKDLAHFYVAGAFGNHIDPEMAITIGMLPDLPLSTFEGLGNTAGRGAAMLLLDRGLFEDIDSVCRQITYVELNVNMELMNEFRGATFIPHTDPRLFPSVGIPEKAMGKGVGHAGQAPSIG